MAEQKRTGLRKMARVAEGVVLAETLAPEPPSTFETPDGGENAKRTISTVEQDQMMREWAAGVPLVEVAERYSVSRNYIRSAMLRRFGSREGMLRALQGLVAENALGAQMIAQEKLHELNAGQAVLAGKMLVETMVQLDKHITMMPKTVNFAALQKLGEAIKEVRMLCPSPAGGG